MVLAGLSNVQLRREEADHPEQQVWEVTRWDDSVEEKTGSVEAVCQNYEVLVEDKRVGKAGGTGTPKRYETWFGPKKSDVQAWRTKRTRPVTG